jgi:uncharacterized membrane protein
MDKVAHVRNVNIEHLAKLTQLERFALWITRHIGTMGFFIFVLSWTALWISWNTFAPIGLRFDAFPAFAVWLFVSNMIQLFFLPLIMVGQNLGARHSEARAEADFEVNVHAETQIESILNHLERQHELILKIIERIEK